MSDVVLNYVRRRRRQGEEPFPEAPGTFTSFKKSQIPLPRLTS